MLVAALAYNLGAKTAQTDALALEAAGLGEAEAAAFWPGVIRVDATQRIDADIATLSGIASPTDADVPTSRPVLTERRPQLAVIIDDVGLDVEVARQLMALEAPVTLSILPYAEAAPTLAAEALASGREVFLHLPMEPVGVEDPGPYALTEFQSAEEMASRIRWAFSRVPGASGFNNHMGSRLTSDQRAMDAVFAATQWPESMIFVDSLTHPRSQAAHSAQSAGLRALTRDVFLDHERDEAAVSDQLNRALALAIQNGQAIAIGHPRPETLSVLADLSRRAEAVGVELVTVSGLDASDPVEADS